MLIRLATALVLLLSTHALARADDALPHLVKRGNTTQLVVDGKPFIMIAGELHNSSASTLEYLAPILPKLSAMNLNTVLVAVSWEQFETEEGEFDYTLIDGMIEQARASNLKLVILWFASWKNGQSSYAPLWVKKDTQRFWRVQTKECKQLETLSPFCDETRNADARAFAKLLRRIRAVDRDSTVIMIQPENEVGIFQEMDYRTEAISMLQQDVPSELIEYLVAHKHELKPHVREAWEAQEYPTRGNWFDLFGDNAASQEFLMAWQMASYIDTVAKAGQDEHPLPMFVNAWIVQKPSDLPGVYPNGGPVAHVMDIYKAAAPSIFTLSPDIYLPNFKETCKQYARDDNPLIIPESTVDAGRAFYAFAEHDAICYSPFGIELRAADDYAFQEAYGALHELKDVIISFQGTGKMHGILREGDEVSRCLTLGQYSVEIVYEKNDEPCYGLIIQTGENEFLVSGVNLRLLFKSHVQNKTGYIGQVWEGSFIDGKWKPLRMLNGDETYHHEALRVCGRSRRIGGFSRDDRYLKPQPVVGHEDASLINEHTFITTPGIYKVTTYLRD